MFGTLGFSYTGLIFLCCLLIPNIIYANNLPKDRFHIEENRALLIFERAGQVFTFALLLIFDDLNVHSVNLWTLWLGGALLLMVAYIICWVRYFTGNHVLADMYRPFLGIPLPLAVLPVAAVFLLAVYGKVIWIGMAGAVLGIGHIGVTARNRQAVKKAGRA